MGAVRVPSIPVGLSTACVYPEDAEAAFRYAAELGYDGVEVLVQTDPVTQDAQALERLSRAYDVPVLSVHSPCLLLTARVVARRDGTDPAAEYHGPDRQPTDRQPMDRLPADRQQPDQPVIDRQPADREPTTRHGAAVRRG